MQGILIYDESERKFTTVLWAMRQMDMPRMARALIDSAHDAENVASEAYLSLIKKNFPISAIRVQHFGGFLHFHSEGRRVSALSEEIGFASGAPN